MNFQQFILKHMRAKFPKATFEDGPEVKKRDFDPTISCSVAWQPEDPAITKEFGRIMSLHQFCSGLESLTRATGVIIYGMGDWPEIAVAKDDEITDRHHYHLEEWGQIKWQPEFDS